MSRPRGASGEISLADHACPMCGYEHHYYWLGDDGKTVEMLECVLCRCPQEPHGLVIY